MKSQSPIQTHYIKSFLYAAIICEITVMLVYFYWWLAIRGVVPSPAQSFVREHTTNSEPVQKVAIVPVAAVRPSAEPDRQRSKSDSLSATSSSAPEEKPSVTTSASVLNPLPISPSTTANLDKVPQVLAARASSNSSPAKNLPSVKLPEATPDDARVAHQWAVSTNGRPVVHVAYMASDIVSLLSGGRGLLVASADIEKTDRREFCLVTPPSSAPEFVQLSTSHVARFSNLVIALHRRNEIARLTEPLPTYFGNQSYSIQFVPDRSLAEQIFINVSRALRAIDGSTSPKKRVVVEGRLSFSRRQPDFCVTKVFWNNGELVFAAND